MTLVSDDLAAGYRINLILPGKLRPVCPHVILIGSTTYVEAARRQILGSDRHPRLWLERELVAQRQGNNLA